MSLHLLLLLLPAFSMAATNQRCSTTGATGPCINEKCDTGNTCLTSSQTCCKNAEIIGGNTNTTSSCIDVVNPSTGISDCPRRISLCNDPVYSTLMAQQCPKTCGKCSGTSTTGVFGSCVDKVNPRSGVSDCPRRAFLCENAMYSTLMAEQCPKTCGKCGQNGGMTTRSTFTQSSCMDKTSPSGTSDCPRLAAYCNNAAYKDLMRTQCPKTCGFC